MSSARQSTLMDAGANLRTTRLRTQGGTGAGLRVSHPLPSGIGLGADIGLVLSTLGGVSDKLLVDPHALAPGKGADLSVGDFAVRLWVGAPIVASVTGEVGIGATRRATERLEGALLVDRLALHPTVGAALRIPVTKFGVSLALGADRLFGSDYEVMQPLQVASGACYAAAVHDSTRAHSCRSIGDAPPPLLAM